MQIVWDTPLPQTRKMVLLSLADQANDHGECYPSIKSVASRCSVTTRAVYLALNDLEAEGWLTREPLPGQKVLFRLAVDKFKQLPLLGTTTERRSPVKQVHTCTTFTGERSAGTGERRSQTGEPRSLPIKATPINQEATALGNARAEGVADGREEQLALLPKFDQDLIGPYLEKLPAAIPLTTWVAFVKHRQVQGRALSFSSFTYLLKDLAGLAADGVDLDESLCQAMKLGLSGPVDPRKKPYRGGAPPRPKVNDDFSDATYASTPDDELPPELRDDAVA